MQTCSNSTKGSSQGSPPRLPSGDTPQAAGQWNLSKETKLVDFLSKHPGEHMDLGLFKKTAYMEAGIHLTKTFGEKPYFTQSKYSQKWAPSYYI